MSHRYYSPLRPLSLGTFPKPQGNEILHIENFEERQNVPEIARQWRVRGHKEKERRRRGRQKAPRNLHK